MEQAQLGLQLKVWKELAISKQMLMRTATDALKQDPNCSQDELKTAIEAFIGKIARADDEVVQAREQAKQAIAELDKKLQSSEQARSLAEASAAELKTRLDNMSREIVIERAAAVKEQQKLKAQLAEKEKALRAINTALADTPENVLRKMNALKKQRQEEADARRQIEASFTSLRAEKQQQNQTTTRLQENSAKLVTTYRDLHALAMQLQGQRATPDSTEKASVPALDETLLEAIEKPDAKAKKRA